MAEQVRQLAAGTRLEQYRIDRTMSAGGFSVVYYAEDLTRNSAVVIKEYFPQKLAKRTPENKIVPLKPQLADAFREGRKLFFQEASILGDLKHPNIVEVINFFDANDTVYMVMDYKPGKNLQFYIKQNQGKLSEVFIRTIFPPLLEGLAVVHKADMLHLDIKPGNIHIMPGGQPLLLDFGAVHRMHQSRILQPIPVVTEGFSPVEQHDPKGYVGPWTDIYAVGATMRACIEGCSPPHSRLRYESDPLKPAQIAFKKKYSKSLLFTIDRAMEVDPVLRPQSVEKLLEMLNSDQAGDAEDQPSMLGKLVSNFPWSG